jgi:hypothetical protein
MALSSQADDVVHLLLELNVVEALAAGDARIARRVRAHAPR